MLIHCFRFFNKTKNEWGARRTFSKVAGKYDLVEIDYSVKNEEKEVIVAIMVIFSAMHRNVSYITKSRRSEFLAGTLRVDSGFNDVS